MKHEKLVPNELMKGQIATVKKILKVTFQVAALHQSEFVLKECIERTRIKLLKKLKPLGFEISKMFTIKKFSFGGRSAFHPMHFFVVVKLEQFV